MRTEDKVKLNIALAKLLVWRAAVQMDRRTRIVDRKVLEVLVILRDIVVADSREKELRENIITMVNQEILSNISTEAEVDDIPF